MGNRQVGEGHPRGQHQGAVTVAKSDDFSACLGAGQRARGCGLAVALILGAAQTCAADGLRAGQWRTINSPEIDGVASPVQQSTRCLTPEAVADLDTTFSPISRTTNSTCERVEHESTPQ